MNYYKKHMMELEITPGIRPGEDAENNAWSDFVRADETGRWGVGRSRHFKEVASVVLTKPVGKL